MEGARLHVLLVEDDAKLARLTRDYCEQQGLMGRASPTARQPFAKAGGRTSTWWFWIDAARL